MFSHSLLLPSSSALSLTSLTCRRQFATAGHVLVLYGSVAAWPVTDLAAWPSTELQPYTAVAVSDSAASRVELLSTSSFAVYLEGRWV